jgi:alpha-beta hydrolase superfamily lysophospholipase
MIRANNPRSVREHAATPAPPRVWASFAGFILWLLALGGGSAVAAPAPSGQTVAFRTEDGVQIAATLHLPSKSPAPAVILVPMQARTREDWEPVASRLAEAGIAAVTIDLRGHGASGPGPGGADAQQNMSASLLDVKAARAFLAGRGDVIGSRIGMAGASVGANLVLAAASADLTVQSLALLSAGIDYRGVRSDAPMRRYGNRPALLVASLEDPYAARSARELSTFGDGIRELRLLSNAGHGTVMFVRQPDLVGVLVDWFRRTLL